MREQFSEPLSPQERTRQLFSKNFDDFAENLRGKVVVLLGTDKKITLDLVEGWNLESNMKTHKNFLQLNPGDWEASRIPIRQMRQSLIIAKDGDRVGACARVVRASYFDNDQGQFIQMPREGDIANYLGLGDNELARLVYMDDSDSLYLLRGEQGSQNISPDEANEQLRRLLEERDNES